jgi:hypothetical protein
MSNFKRGDVVGFVFGGPGPDITYLLITAVREDEADMWDLTFEFEVTRIKLEHLWIATEKELDRSMRAREHKESATIRELAKEARDKFGIKNESP